MNKPKFAVFGCSGTIAAIALGFVVGLVVGMPLIIQKKEAGFLAIFAFPVLSFLAWQAIQKLIFKSKMTVDEDNDQKYNLILRYDRLIIAIMVFVATPVVVGIIAWQRGKALKLHPADIAIDIDNYSQFGLWIGLIVAFPLAISALFRD